MEAHQFLYFLVVLLPVLFAFRRILHGSSPHRTSHISPAQERVLVLGGSSGIGRVVAHLYAARGASVCVVGRRESKLKEVEEECKAFAKSGTTSAHAIRVFTIAADFSTVEDMVRVRTTLESRWQGIDTVIVSAGVSALRPILSVAGVEAHKAAKFTPHATEDGIRRLVQVSAAATTGNYVGPLVAAATFIPLLSNTSRHPAILLVSSLAAVCPAPTRALYGSTKAASLMLYQSLAIEHPAIKFSFILPATVEGDFRSSAVDIGEARPPDSKIRGLKQIAVAERCIKAVDQSDRTVFMPPSMRVAPFLYWIWPWYIEQQAKKLYNF